MKTLSAAIARYNEQKAQKVPRETLDIMDEATRALLRAGIADHSLRSGDRAPGFELPNHLGESRSLSSMLEHSTVVLTFYRGGWCPYCNLELNALQQRVAEMEALGAILVAISPEQPDRSLETRERHALAFDVLHDQGNRIAERFGLVFTLPESLRPIYQSFGIDIPAYNGDDSFRLPIPATYIIGRDGVIRHDFVDPDYTRRMEPQEIIDRLA
ncbi:MAG TPA: AhpC/TSA family protein [Sedimenticola thiotaurini]|uniref:thioredoxin-dependent peroxiredoxin n=1 Tax=Sedimenticola thiotaurini TaxID=1543721 RepID=A0A831RMY9_9GAMM|nr:AhpC/TSA family protein [Sedimenticola thiotaurini]